MPLDMIRNIARDGKKSPGEVERMWNDSEKSIRQSDPNLDDSEVYKRVEGGLKGNLGIEEDCEDDDKELEETSNHMGEKEYSSFKSWKTAVKKINPKVKIEGDKDIANAKGVGEWDGEIGVIYNLKEDILIKIERLLGE